MAIVLSVTTSCTNPHLLLATDLSLFCPLCAMYCSQCYTTTVSPLCTVWSVAVVCVYHVVIELSYTWVYGTMHGKTNEVFAICSRTFATRVTSDVVARLLVSELS